MSASNRSGGGRARRVRRLRSVGGCWVRKRCEFARSFALRRGGGPRSRALLLVKTCFAAGPREPYRRRRITHMFLGTLRCYERSFVQAAAATSVSSPIDEERRTNSARPRIASARAAAAAFARSSTSFVEAPSRTKLLRRSIMAGAPVERGVNGSLLAVESMVGTLLEISRYTALF